jgi:hypothetical protein
MIKMAVRQQDGHRLVSQSPDEAAQITDTESGVQQDTSVRALDQVHEYLEPVGDAGDVLGQAYSTEFWI